MYIKRYTLAVIMLIGVTGWYAYTYLKETHSVMDHNFFGYQLPEAPIYAWILIPLVVLYIVSVLHMAFYSFLGSFKLRKYEKDSLQMIDSIVSAYLGKKDRKHEFKTERYKIFGALIDNTTLIAHSSISRSSSNVKVNEVVNLIEDIKNAKTVDLKAYNLDADNELVIQNNRNKYDNEDITIEEILDNSQEFDTKLLEDVYVKYTETATLEDIEKYQVHMTFSSLLSIVGRINAEENTLEVSNETLIELLNNLTLSEDDYVEMSIALSQSMIPEQRIKLFEILSEDNEIVMKAYLFTLFDLEMIDLATDILNNSQPEEFMKFKAYNALKDSQKNFNIKLFI